MNIETRARQKGTSVTKEGGLQADFCLSEPSTSPLPDGGRKGNWELERYWFNTDM